MNLRKIGAFVGGILFGTAGVAILSSQDAKNVYTHCTAAVLRGKDRVVKTAMNVKENCGDIYEDARDINDKRYSKQEIAKVEAARAIVEEYEHRGDESEVEETQEEA